MQTWSTLRVCLLSLAILSTPADVRAQEAATQAQFSRILAQPVAVDFDKTPLADVLDHLRTKYRANIFLDAKALDDVGFSYDTPVTFHMQHGAFAATLTAMLKQIKLTWIASGEVIEVTTPEEAEARLPTLLYDLRDLVAAGREAEIHPVSSMAALQMVLPSCVAAETWNDVGGPGCMLSFRGKLLVSQIAEVHREIEEFLAELRRVKGGLPTSHDPFDKTMDATFSFSVTDRPLTEVAAMLGRQTKLDVRIDRRALADMGLSPDLHVSGGFENLPLRSALRTFLKPQELTWKREGKALLITTTEEAESVLAIRIYDVRGLLPLTVDGAGEIAAYARLSERLKASLAPDTWDDVGGYGSTAPFDGMLIVAHTEEIHEQVRKFLAAGVLKKTDADRAADTMKAPRSYRISTDALPPRTGAPRVTCNFVDTPLDEALQSLERAAGVRILLHENDLAHEELSVRRPVSLRLHDVAIETALDYLLRGPQLTWYLREGTFHVTTQEATEAASLETRRYPVADLLQGQDREALSRELLVLVISTVAPETWKDVGGYGSAGEKNGELEITQTQRIHWKIAALLESVRAALRGP